MPDDAAATAQDTSAKNTPAQNTPGSGPGKTGGAGTQTKETSRTSEMPGLIPPADIYENNKEVLLLLDMPGADPKSLDVTLDSRVLSISARSTPWRPEGYTPVTAEYSEGNYQRSFILPEQADGDNIKALFKDGVLRLNVPKAAPPPAKKIAVTAS